MRLITQLLSKKLENSETNGLNEKYLNEVWDFYQVFNLVNAIEKRHDDENMLKKNELWEKLVENNDEELLIALKRTINNDRRVISDTMRELITKEKESLVIDKNQEGIIASYNW